MTISDIEASWLEEHTGILAKLRLAAASLERHVVPVFHLSDNSKLQSAGSGVLARLAERNYLISAAHVFDHCDEGVFVPFSSGAVEPLTNVTIVSKPPNGGTRDDDRMDVGFVRLTASEAQAFGIERMLDLEVVGGPPMPIATTMFLVIGYPHRDFVADSTRGRISSDVTHLMTGVADAAAYKRAGIDPRLNLLLRLNRRVIATRKSIGAPPNMRGISGGGVWPVRVDLSGEELMPFFAGIVIERSQRFRSSLTATLGSAIRYFVRRFDDTEAT